MPRPRWHLAKLNHLDCRPAGDCAKLVMRRVPARRRLGGACLAVRVPVATERGRDPLRYWDRRSGGAFRSPSAGGSLRCRRTTIYSRNRLGARPEKTQEGALQRVESPFVMQKIALTTRQRVSEEAPRARSRQLDGARRRHVDVNQTQ
jgi:hypothetical protein